jgi:hypothetical protein
MAITKGEAWERAAACARRAEAAENDEARHFFMRLRNSYIRLANGYSIAHLPEVESDTNFLEELRAAR